MDAFLSQEAYYNHITREASTTLVFDKHQLAAYFTLQRAKIQLILDNEELTVDALELARLAVDEQYQQRGVGTYIIKRIKEIAFITNERYIKTDALFEKWPWYQKRGFEYVIEDEIVPDKTTGFVYMIMDLYNEDLINEYFEL